MNELYWISRLDTIITVSRIISIMSIIGLSFSLVFYFSTLEEDDEDCPIKEAMKKLRRIILYLLISSVVVSIFTPTTKEAYIIFGVGGTIDYLRSNEKARQIPDKCIDAVDMFLDSVIKKDTVK